MRENIGKDALSVVMQVLGYDRVGIGAPELQDLSLP
jgi:hypothetical protein